MLPDNPVHFVESVRFGWELISTVLMVAGFIWLLLHENKRKKIPKE